MCNTFNIKRVPNVGVEAAQICKVMDEAGIGFVGVDSHCWASDYPYRPKMEVRMAHNGGQLLINYRVSEECVRAVAQHDNGNVWEDSCCELFISPVADGTYYNIECNAAGQMLIGFGPKREGRERATQEVLDKVGRWSSLGREPFGDRMGQTTWQLCLAVPVEAFYHHSLKSLDALRVKGNVYKCGDKLPHPHFMSMFPIDLPKPDFHRPDFFGDVCFE